MHGLCFSKRFLHRHLSKVFRMGQPVMPTAYQNYGVENNIGSKQV
jgi:hypothetical protein